MHFEAEMQLAEVKTLNVEYNELQCHHYCASQNAVFKKIYIYICPKVWVKFICKS